MTDLATTRYESVREAAVLWGFFHDLFRIPSPGQWAWLHQAPVKAAWGILAGEYSDAPPEILPDATTFQAYEETFMAAFEVGLPEPLCPLIESHWNRRDAVTAVLHENVLFYKQFGLELRPTGGESADHLRNQIEFMHYLCRLEGETAGDAGRGDYPAQIARARQDFLDRHLAHWTALAAEHLEQHMPGEWPAHWMRLVAVACHSAAGADQ